MSSPHGRPIRVAVDLLGGDDAPAVTVDAVRQLLERPALNGTAVAVTAVGPRALVEAAGWAGGHDGLRHVDADDVVAMADDARSTVRARPRSTIRVALQLLADGEVDAVVSAGSTGATIASAHLAVGRLPGFTRSVLAAVLPGVANPVVVLDVGGSLEATPDNLAECAAHGAAYATARLGLPAPRVGLLSVGAERGKGDALRLTAAPLIEERLAGGPAVFVGNVEGNDVPLGSVDVVVTDGFTGNVLLKGLEGAVTLVRATLQAGGATAAADLALLGLDPQRTGGALLLGVPGVVVVGHGSSSAAALVSCVDLAVEAVRGGWVPAAAPVSAPVLFDAPASPSVSPAR